MIYSSTSDAVRQLFDNFAENINQKKYNCAVFLDLKKAFDTVNHQILGGVVTFFCHISIYSNAL